MTCAGRNQAGLLARFHHAHIIFLFTIQLNSPIYGPELNSDACVARNDTIKERVRTELMYYDYFYIMKKVAWKQP